MQKVSHRKPISNSIRSISRKLHPASGRALWDPLTPAEVGKIEAALFRSIIKGKLEAASFFARSLAHFFAGPDE